MTCADPPPRALDAVVAALAAAAALLVVNRKVGLGGLVPSAAATLLHVASAVGMLRGRGTAHTWVRLGVAAAAAFVVARHAPAHVAVRASGLHGTAVARTTPRVSVQAAAALHVAALAAAALMGDPCNDPPPGGYAAELSVLALTAALAPGGLGLVWCGAEAVVIAAALVRTEIPDKASHLTWWMLGSLAAFDFSLVADALCGTATARLAHPFLLVLSVVVIIGVLAMSVARCSLLRNALKGHGAGVYVAGNFAMHYYPALRALAAVRPWANHRLYRVSELKAAAIVTIYALAYDPVDEYGCSNMPDSSWAPLILGGIAIVTTFLVPTA